MRVGSLFSGIGGLDLGLERAGMKVQWQVEIDPFRRRVLKQHWPDVEQFEDVRDISYTTKTNIRQQSNATETGGDLSCVDLLCGGFPCQDLSVAGRRAGIRAERSGLFFEFARLAGELRPDWLLIENVPGLLSSNQGKDFQTVLETLSELGYVCAWRILDSRYFGVPQRRRRVYIVGHIRADYAAAVLFEPKGGAGDTQAGREAGKRVAYALTGSPRGTGDGHRGTDDIDHTTIVSTPVDPDGVREAAGVPRRVDGYVPEITAPLKAADPRRRNGGSWPIAEEFIASPLEASDGHHGHSSPRGDGADNLVVGGKGENTKPCCPDGPRYAALGDAITVNVANWIGKRIMIIEQGINSGEAK